MSPSQGASISADEISVFVLDFWLYVWIKGSITVCKILSFKSLPVACGLGCG